MNIIDIGIATLYGISNYLFKYPPVHSATERHFVCVCVCVCVKGISNSKDERNVTLKPRY